MLCNKRPTHRIFLLVLALCLFCAREDGVPSFGRVVAAQVQLEAREEEGELCDNCDKDAEESSTHNTVVEDETQTDGDMTSSSQNNDEIYEENGIKVLTKVDHFFSIFKSLSQAANNGPILMLTVVYSHACPHSQDLIEKVEQAAIYSSKYIDLLDRENGQVGLARPTFGKIDVEVADATWIQEQFQTESVPDLLFVRGQMHENDIAFDLLDYEGLKSSPNEIVATVLHNWYRFALNSAFTLGKGAKGPTLGETEHDTPVFEMSTYDELVSFLRMYGSGLLNHLIPTVPPELRLNEKWYMDWLLNEKKHTDPFSLFVQCRSEPPFDAFHQYDELAHSMSQRRDVAFFAVRECDNLNMDNNGQIVALMVDGNTSWRDVATNLKFLSETSAQYVPSGSEDKSMSQFIVTHTTPLLLWYDRKTVAPMAFSLHRQVHAVLFVDMHIVMEWEGSQQELLEHVATNSECLVTRDAIERLRSACYSHRLHPENRGGGDIIQDMVCLVVPSTETRLMNTFGVDMWVPLDTAATYKRQSEESIQVDVPAPILPSLLVTDRRFGGTARYYLRAASIIEGHGLTPSSIEVFLLDFWHNLLTPDRRSQNQAPSVNKSGVKVLSGDAFENLVVGSREKHTLVYFFAPTCGHCKRFSILWNELSRVVRYLEFDAFLELVKVDVTQNEIRVQNYLDIQEVPDIYYYPVGNKNPPVRYDIMDELGDGAGRLSDPLDMLDWLLDVSEGMDGLDEEVLLQLIMDKKAVDGV